MKLAPYPEYRETGETWFKNVPAHWKTLPLCAVARTKSITNCVDRELLSVYLDLGVIRFSDVKEKRTNATSEDLSKYQAVDPGDFVLNNQQAWRGSVGVSKYSGIVSPAYLVLEVHSELYPDYANVLFRDRKMVNQYLVSSKGVGSIQRNLYWPHLKRATVAIPPVDEQVRIAKVVKSKAAQINKFIRNKRRLIELLKEQKQNVINQAVTRGLDPKVNFKPSGVEWIGDIPEHWEACQLKRYLLRNDGGVWGSGFSEDGVIVFRSTEQTVDGQWRITDPARRILTEAERIGAILEAGDLLVTKSSGSPSHIGKTTLVTDEIAALSPCFSNFMQRLRVKQRVEPEYLWLYMNSRAARTQLQYLSNSTTGLGNLSESIVGRIVAFLPPKPEQLAILSGLKSEMTPIDTAIQKAENEIELMREYRTRLISDVVTGQVDVRGIEVPEVAEDELLALEEDTADVVIDDEGDMDETD